jgi:ribosomal protein S12 methylthiotransferase accessory factor YcaO
VEVFADVLRREKTKTSRKTKTSPKTCEESIMKTKTAADLNSQHDDANLDRRYGKIGISAVAAALHYQSDARNPAYAPVVSQADQWLAEREAA